MSFVGRAGTLLREATCSCPGLLHAIPQQLKQPDHVLVPHEHRQINSDSFGPNSCPIWRESHSTFAGEPGN